MVVGRYCFFSCFLLALSLLLAALPSVAQEQIVVRASPSSHQVRSFKNSIEMKFVLIPSGKFRMGSNSGSKPEKPAHDVTISKSFYLGATEVTQSQWQAVMGTTPWKGEAVYHPKEGPDYPACNVNPIQAAEFCKRLSVKEAKTYRLPTEAEWEYACRAGTTTPYSFGRDESINDYAWTQLNAFNKKGEQFPHKVGLKKPNPWGLYDMHGNVKEWCSDYWGDYPNKAVTDPTGPREGEYQVYRGGSWYGNIVVCRSAVRGGGMPLDVPGEQVDIGFRVVCVPSQPVKKSAQPDRPNVVPEGDRRDVDQ